MTFIKSTWFKEIDLILNMATVYIMTCQLKIALAENPEVFYI